MSTDRVAWAAITLIAIAGCSRPSPADAPLPSAPGPAESEAPAARHAYVCEDGRILSIVYPDRDTADLQVDGERHRLQIAISGSGARYVGDGLQWWNKGEEGWLATLRPGETIASELGAHCVPPAQAPVSAPEPGTPGGLPDDRTPLAERPAEPGGAQEAATLVETYFGLLETGKADEAAGLRRDGMTEDLSQYASYHAQVGAPGPVEGAAGSLYVDVPVVIYGRMAGGAAFHRKGQVTLRRVNNVPGATAEQLKWRIERITYSP
jgi:membrane-bound inhibitor of C-type lysozyme